jgi:hypothetical protein
MSRDELIEELKKFPDVGDVVVTAKFDYFCYTCRQKHEIRVELKVDGIATVPTMRLEASE